jgi:hypothetical protein
VPNGTRLSKSNEQKALSLNINFTSSFEPGHFEGGIVGYITDAANTSACFPQYAIPVALVRSFFPELPVKQA